MNRLFSGSFILLLAIVLSFCAKGDKGSPSHSFRIYEEDGITIAETSGGPKYEKDLFRYERTLELKQDPDIPESLLVDPVSMRRDSDGNTYVVDSGDYRIVKYDLYGRYVRSFGRQGSGPGEFTNISFPHIADGILCVFDRWQNRMTRFAIDGDFLDLVTIRSGLNSGPRFTSLDDVILVSDGRRILLQRHMGRGEDMNRRGFTALVLGSENDSLWSVSTPMLISAYTVSRDNSISIIGIPYEPVPSIACSPQWGICVSDGDKPVLNHYTLAGVNDLQIRIELDREPVSLKEKIEIHRRLDDQIAEAEGRVKEMRKAQKDALVIADQKPFWTSILVDDSGYIWLEISETLEQSGDAGGSLFRVLSPEGEYLGDSRWPARLYNTSFSLGYLMFIETDEETLEEIPVVYRILPAVEGLEYP